MRVIIRFHEGDLRVNEEFCGRNADEVVSHMKARVGREFAFPLRMAINAMSNTGFVQDAVRRINRERGLRLPIPQSCSEFIQLAQEQGIATVQDE